jgi:hypothetical protein
VTQGGSGGATDSPGSGLMWVAGVGVRVLGCWGRGAAARLEGAHGRWRNGVAGATPRPWAGRGGGLPKTDGEETAAAR